MANLASLQVPFLSGYRQREAAVREEGMDDLRAVGSLAQLQAQMQAQQEKRKTAEREAQYRTAISAAKTPEEARAIAANFASPDALLKMKTEGGFTLGDTRYDAEGGVIATNPKAIDEKPESEPLLRLQTARTKLAASLPADHPILRQIDDRIGLLTSRPDKAEASSPLGKLITERDAFPVGHPSRAIYDKAITEYKPGNSTSVTVSPTLQLGKEGSNKVDVGLLDTTAGVMRLSAIEGQFKPQFQQWLPRAGAAWSAIKESLGGNLNAGDKQMLTEFTAYKRNAINSLNEYIKQITGAAMSEPEAQRILRGMPNPGQGITDGDSPTEFKSKLDDAMKQTKMALARYEYIKRNGMALTKPDGSAVVPLERMPEIMNSRGKQLEAQIRASNPNANAAMITNRVSGLLAKEFGLVQ
jgi:hypothetical protein